MHWILFSMLDNYALFQNGSSTGRSIQHDVFVAELSGAVVRYLRVKPKPLDAGLVGSMPAADPMTLPSIGVTAPTSQPTSLPAGDPHSLPPMPPLSRTVPAGDPVTVPVKGPHSEW